MSIFDEAETREMIEFVESAMSDAAGRIEEPGEKVETSPGKYETSYTLVDDLTDVPVAFAPATPGSVEEIFAGGGIQSTVEFLMKVPVGTPIRANQRMIVTHELEGIPSPLVFYIIGPYWKTTRFSQWFRATLRAPSA